MKKIYSIIAALLLSMGLFSQSITITQPNGGELLYGCQTYLIKWTSSGVSNYYNIDYSLNSGSQWVSVASNINITNNQYSWTVPMINSNTVWVRVRDKNDTTKQDRSNNHFTIQLPINITSPNGGEVWQGLSTQTVAWTPAGTSGFFNLHYSIDNGSSWISVANNANSNNYIWTVPNNPSATALFRVQDATTSCQLDISNAVFEISPSIPVLTSPNGAEQWTINSSRNITWNPATFYGPVKIEWSFDNGANYNTIVSSASNTGSYAWTIPNTPSNQCFVRISNATGSLVNDVSTAAFTIKWPTNFITSPNGGEVWRSQNTHNITWDASVFVSNVRIEYSTNAGATWNQIVSSYSNTGTYTWTIPSMVTNTQALIRIVNNTWPSNILDTSNAVFTILAPVTVDSPNIGTSLTGCSQVSIQWSRANTFNNYNNSDNYSYYLNQYELFYSVNGGPDQYIANVSNYQNQYSYSYTWTVPDLTPGNVKVKVVARWNSYGSGGGIFWTDSSDVASPVVDPTGTITIVNPNGGVTLNALTPYTISWTASGTSGYFDVLYSVNGGNSYGTLASNISASSYLWTVNNNPSTTVFIKVRDNQNVCRKDISNAANSIIAATPILTSPNGGETLYVNGTYNITWNTGSIHGSVNLDYSTDNGVSWNSIVTGTTNNGSYTWNIPNTVSTQALVRISNLGTLTNNDQSNAVFNIAMPANFLTSPNGGETWRSQNTHAITWNSALFTANVKIEYSIDNASTWNIITNSYTNSGSYSWTIPAMVYTNQALIRITNVVVPAITDVSDAVFTIKPPVMVDYPNTSSSLTGCSSINIQWSRCTAFNNYNNSDSYSYYLNQYELYYNVNGGPDQYIANVPNYQTQYTYSYNWTIPDLTPGAIKVKIVARYNSYGSGGGIFWTDSSDVAAPIVNPTGTIIVTNPNGGVNLNALNNYNITWTASGTSGYFDVQYSTNGGASYGTIASNISGNAYNWNVVNNPTTNMLVKIRDNQNICRKDISNAANTIIAATPILTSPNGGEVWKVNSSQNITWNTATLYGPVSIEYSIDNGASWNIVINSTSNTGSYTWTVPNTITTQALIRISNVATPLNTDVSNATFTINLPTPILTSPNGGETWRSLNTQNITWDASTVASNVKIEYSTDNGSTWNLINASYTNSGSYPWAIPSMLTTTQALVRITNTSFPTAIDTSNAVFTIKAPVTVDVPNTSTNLTGCSTLNIQWTRSTAFNNYNNSDSYSYYRNQYELYYNVNGGPDQYIANVENYQSQYSYSYNWTIPDLTPGSIKIKVIARYNSYGSGGGMFWTDSSDVAAPIVNPNGTITVNNPNGGVSLNALTNYNITWTASGTSGYFDVQYSTNGGASYGTIASNISGNAYNWNVVNSPTTNMLVKIRDNQNICRKDVSNANNTIIAATPILTSPNGGEVWKVNSSQNITWNTATLYGPVSIEYSIDNGASWNIVINSTSNTGSYTWTVPNTITTQALIRISNVATPLNTDVSNATFTINLPTPILTSPNGGETWRSLNTQNITWDASTVASNVKIEYSTDNGSTWNLINASYTNSGSYPWAIPSMLTSTQALVRITNTSFPTAIDTSNAVFTIKAPVTVDVPNTSTNLTGCSTLNIQWTRSTAFNNYNNSDSYSYYRNQYELYYNVNGGPDQYIANVENYQSQYSYSYNWTIPDLTPGSIKIKVIARYNSYGSGGGMFWTDSSDVAAPIVNPNGTITVNNPNGGVTMNALNNYNITWTATGTSGYFDILYSANGGSSFNTVVSNISANSYLWNVPNNPSTNVLVKIRDNQNNCRKDVSNATNTIIAATPVLSSPNGGETLYVNGTYNITWNTATFYTNVFIEYSIDNGVTWNNVISATSNTGSYSWAVPNTLTSQALIRISNVGTPSYYDVSNATFSIVYPTNFLTAPNGGEVWRSQNVHNITWNSSLFTSNVKLEFSTDNGTTWNLITSANSNLGSYPWSIPAMVTNTQALIRITNNTVPAITDVSDAVFTILAPITVDYPTTGNSLTACANVNIQWTRTYAFSNYNNSDSYSYYRNNYELYYKVNNGPEEYIGSTQNYQSQYSYSYSWTVPDVAPGNIKIIIYSKMSSYGGGGTFWIDSSDLVSPVVSPSGTITVTAPNGGVTLNALNNYNVTWTANGTTGFYDVQYSTNGGVSYNTIASNVTGNAYTWNVNNTPSTNMFIKVRDNQNVCRKDFSDAVNTIMAATPILTTPNGSEVWNVNSTQNITWNTNTLYGPVFIEISTDNGVTYNNVVTSASNTGAYAWTLPMTPSPQARIRISNVNNPALFDVSNNPFTIQIPTPIVTAPNGGETWYAGTNQNITWTPSSFFTSTVNIEYSLDGGNTWAVIVSNQTNNGLYTWTVPNLNSTSALIKVSNYNFPSNFDVSNALFTLRPYVRLLTPNGGELLGSCTQTTITFEKAPFYTNFNIEYSTDNGASWTALQTNQTYSNTVNNYNWTIPNTPSTQTLVRVTPYNVPTRADQSDALFTIKKAVTIIQPNYGGVLVAGSTYLVKWQSDGISNIYDLAYSTNGPTGTFTNIVLGYNTSTNTYSWTVPNTPSTNCYLRIRDNITSCKEDISDLSFTIASSVNPITLTAPNGGDTLSACQTYNITWSESSTPIGNYNISYSIDYGTNWIPIVSNYLTTSGTYTWVVPNTTATGALVRVQSGLNPTVFDYSNALFVIKPGRLYTNADQTICSGSSVQLNTTGGSNYSWSPTTGLSNPTIPNPLASPSITTQYTVTSNSSGCFLQDTILITVNLSSGLTASVTITPSTSTAICSGTPVLFTATPINGGSSPAYQWKLNGTNVGTNTYTYSASGLNSGDIITCVMTSSLQCVSNSPATSNAINMTVLPNVTPSVSIATPLTNVCSGANVVFTASPVNGGASPAYQWKKNGVNVGSNANTYSVSNLANLDVISVEMTSNAVCASPLIVTSNSILMTINTSTTPSVVISTPNGTVCSGSSVTFTAVPANAGATPTYQWKVNGTNAGNNSNIFTTSTLANNSVVTCDVTSSANCNTINTVTSNSILMTVTTAPAAPVAISNSPVTTNGTITLFASTIPGATYTWSGPNGFNSTAQNPTIANATASNNGTYSVFATVSGCSGTTGTTVVSVSGTPLNVNISGTILTEQGSLISGVKVKRTGASVDSLFTTATGQYLFSVTQGSNLVITPSKNNDLTTYNGITTFDLVLMQRHVLNTQLLNTPYKIIAADVNASNTVTNLDIVLTKSLILQNITSFPGNKLWAFANSSYVFPIPSNPFPYESNRSYSSANTAIDQNFIGVKLGDVNNSWDPLVAKDYGSDVVAMQIESKQALHGDVVTIPVSVAAFDKVSGFQYTISWNSSVLEFVGVSNGSLDMNYGTSQVSNGKLTALWATENLNGQTLADGSVIFDLTFRVVGNNGDSSPISINAEITELEAVNSQMQLISIASTDGMVKVVDASGISTTEAAGYHLMQNVPNPFADKTSISFSLPSEDKVIITIYDLFGKKITEITGIYTAGMHTIIWDGTDAYGTRLSVGTYYYRFQSGKFVGVKKMIIFK